MAKLPRLVPIDDEPERPLVSPQVSGLSAMVLEHVAQLADEFARKVDVIRPGLTAGQGVKLFATLIRQRREEALKDTM